jgi:aspartate 1-decarboxylase
MKLHTNTKLGYLNKEQTFVFLGPRTRSAVKRNGDAARCVCAGVFIVKFGGDAETEG